MRVAVDEVLGIREYRDNVERLRTETHGLPDQHVAVGLIERVSVERAPVPNT
jgi:hypothetical protein